MKAAEMPLPTHDGPRSSTTNQESGSKTPDATTTQAIAEPIELIDPQHPEQVADEDNKDPGTDTEGEGDGYGSDGSSISNPVARVSTARQKEIVRKRVRQHAQHIQLTEDRIRALEGRMDVLENNPPEEQASTTSTPEKIPACPHLKFVDWEEFKATKNVGSADERHAIDVLVGKSVLFHQQNKKAIHLNQSGMAVSNTEEDNLPLSSIPERIRINSQPLNEVLKHTIRGSFRSHDVPIVILQPYKPLLYHEDDLRNTLAALEKKFTPKVIQQSSATDNDKLVLSSFSSSQEYAEETPTDNDEEDGEDYTSVQAMRELHCLIRFIDALKPCIQAIRSTTEQLISKDGSPAVTKTGDSKGERALVRFDELWYIFQPGQYVLSPKGNQRLLKVIQSTGGRPYLSTDSRHDRVDGPNVEKYSQFQVDCYNLDFDGEAFGPVHHRFKISAFDNRKPITALEVFPVEYASDYDAIMQNLYQNGRKFVDATRTCHKYFVGRTVVWTPSGTKMEGSHPEDVDSPVIVDFNRTLQYNPEWCPMFGIPDLAQQDGRETREMTLHDEVMCGDSGHCMDANCCQNESILEDFEWDARRMDDITSKDGLFAQLNARKGFIPSPSHYNLCPHSVFGFILRSRKWGKYSDLHRLRKKTLKLECSLLNLRLSQRYQER